VLFTETLFFFFFAVVFALHWGLRGHVARKRLLLTASYVFYAAWDWRFCGLILLSTLIDFVAGRRLGDAEPRSRRFWLLVSVITNLSLLGVFKYFNFFVESANSLFGLIGLGEVRSLDLILPVGISFYTFQTMSYTIDVYRRRLDPISNFSDFALFVSFFPQLVMGPILRASGFLPQLQKPRRFENVPVRSLLTLFLIGFVKKACVADNIAPLVDNFYLNPGGYDVASTWIVIVFYAVQLYCDFSGYTDMAIAVAGLLGYQVPRNFAFPLLASNISDFWRRWHISFSSWLRDYLYIPLGGSRKGPVRTYVNLTLTMLLSGLWHGAGWTFITWGALNGIGLCVHRLYERWNGAPAALRRVTAALGWPLTVFWFAFTLVFFRSQTFSDAWAVTTGLLSAQQATPASIGPTYALWFVLLLAVHWISRRTEPSRQATRVPAPLFAFAFGILCAIALSFVRMEYRPFIYFQF